jgi:hypothetical protein
MPRASHSAPTSTMRTNLPIIKGGLLLLAGLILVAAPAAAAERPATLVLTVPAGTTLPTDLAAVVWVAGEPSPANVITDRSTSIPTISVEEACRPGATVVLGGTGVVSEPLVIGDESVCTGQPTTVRFFPAAAVSGTAVVAAPQKLPKCLWLRVAIIRREAGEIEVGAYPLALSEQGTFSAQVPADLLELSLRSGPLAAAPLPIRVFYEGRSENLGRITLKPGAVLLAKVISTDDGRPVSGAHVKLVPEEHLDHAVRLWHAGVAELRTPAAVSNDRGWVTLTGLTEGRYFFLVRKAGLGPALRQSVEVRAGENVFDRVEIGRPARLVLTVPGLDLLEGEDLGLQANAVPVIGGRDFSSAARLTPFDHAGQAAFSDLPAGEWHVAVAADFRFGLPPFGEKVIEVLSGQEIAVTLETPALVVRGRVEFRDKPVKGEMLFSLREPNAQYAFTVRSGDDGRFAAMVREKGLYQVSMRGREPKIEGEVADVEIPLDGREIVIELPDGTIEGLVVDSAGHPAPQAAVSAKCSHEVKKAGDTVSRISRLSNWAQTNESGRFAMEALAKCEWEVRARAKGQSSDAKTVALTSDRMTASVVLTLRPEKSLEGIVLSASGTPVARATLLVSTPPSTPAGIPGGSQIQSDAEGRFQFDLPPDMPMVFNFEVRALNQPLAAYRVEGQNTVKLVLPPIGGSVRFRPPAGGWGQLAVPLTRMFLIADDGAFLSLFHALDVRSNEALIPLVQPGRYRLVRPDLTSTDVLALYANWPGRPVLATFDVPPGGIAEINLQP